MTKKSRGALRDDVKQQYVAKLVEFLTESGEDVGLTKANEFNFPVVDSEGNEDFVKITVVIPSGSRDGEPYDGYGERVSYEMKCKDKKEKAEVAAKKKAEKIARDEKYRAEKARQKQAEQERRNGE